jgi:tetratricopeptide (TPR) repeat protein
MRILRLWVLMLALVLAAAAAHAGEPTREQALRALEQSEPDARLAAVERLGEIGQMADADRLLGRLSDSDVRVRASANDAIWRIWSRSGDPAIDKLFARGLEQMQESAFDAALETFSTIIARKPDFAEGWNKRATIYFLLGENAKSLKDCDEVLKRNPNHFGALSGVGQIYMKLGEPEQALKSFRRALDVNPNLEGIAQVIPRLEQYLRDRERKTI